MKKKRINLCMLLTIRAHHTRTEILTLPEICYKKWSKHCDTFFFQCNNQHDDFWVDDPEIPLNTGSVEALFLCIGHRVGFIFRLR